jgi:hypothetical protein
MASSLNADYTTMRVSVELTAQQANVYALAGTLDSGPLTAPAAYQVAAPFGADIGGVSPAFFPIANNDALGYSEFDSWLTVGVTDGSAPGAIAASPGFDIATMWTATTPLLQNDGAVFYMDPTTMGSNSGSNPVVLMQITMLSANMGLAGETMATATVQGNLADSLDSWSSRMVWKYP